MKKTGKKSKKYFKSTPFFSFFQHRNVSDLQIGYILSKKCTLSTFNKFLSSLCMTSRPTRSASKIAEASKNSSKIFLCYEKKVVKWNLLTCFGNSKWWKKTIHKNHPNIFTLKFSYVNRDFLTRRRDPDRYSPSY